jgi:hypothetical protein
MRKADSRNNEGGHTTAFPLRLLPGVRPVCLRRAGPDRPRPHPSPAEVAISPDDGRCVAAADRADGGITHRQERPVHQKSRAPVPATRIACAGKPGKGTQIGRLRMFLFRLVIGPGPGSCRAHARTRSVLGVRVLARTAGVRVPARTARIPQTVPGGSRDRAARPGHPGARRDDPTRKLCVPRHPVRHGRALEPRRSPRSARESRPHRQCGINAIAAAILLLPCSWYGGE